MVYLTSLMMSPTCSRPCWSTIPPWRMRAIVSSPPSTLNVTPWNNQHRIEKYKSTAASKAKLHTIYSCVQHYITVLLWPTRCSPATLRMPTMRIASGGRNWLCLWLSSGSLSTQSHGLDGGLSQAWDATESWVSSRDWQKHTFYFHSFSDNPDSTI